jgi:HPt (histidine-containing phosphotransfer) domain-containing protein
MDSSETAPVAGADDDVDEEILSELLSLMGDGPPDGLAEIFTTFLTGVPARLADIDGALRNGRLEEAGRAAHTLRGTAGAFGANRLYRLAGELEVVCQSSDAGRAGSLLAEMRTAFATFERILRARIPPPEGT